MLDDGRSVSYRGLVACPGIKLDWDAIPGLSETLGKNGVTSNYRYDLAPYTHRLVKDLKSGRALFTQPPMPIKCAGDRKSVVSGKSVSVRVDLGGRRIIKKKKKQKIREVNTNDKENRKK